MLVTEAKIFNPSVMKITVTNMEGVRWVSDVNSDVTIDELKVLAASHFYSPSESVKASMFKLVHVTSCRSLTEEHTATQEGVNTGDELLLIQKRMPPSQTEPPDGHRKGPDQAMIDNLTKHITPRNTTRPTHEAPTVLDFQAELRKILISLIDAAQKLLCLNPKASQILKQAEEMLDEKTSAQPEVDPEALTQLKDMGFTEQRAKKALILNGMLPTEAMDWLLQHEDDPDIDTPLPGMEELASDSDKDTPEGATGPPVTQTTEGAKVCKILKSFRRYKKRSFNPNPIALRKLIEMGFEEKDVIEALRVNGNHQNLSCEWLLDPDRKRTNMEDIDKGLDIEGPIYRAIMENPAVQLGLNNPRSLLAFLEMIENPNSTTRWLNDSDTGPMLIQISRIYHSEKHAAGDDKAPSS